MHHGKVSHFAALVGTGSITRDLSRHLGNEKGGAGKTTLAMHVAIALMKDGQRVGKVVSISRLNCISGNLI